MRCLLEGRRLLERDTYFSVNTQRYGACQRKYGNSVNGGMLITMNCVIMCVRCNWKKGILLRVLYDLPGNGIIDGFLVVWLYRWTGKPAGKQAKENITSVKGNIPSQFLPYPRFLGYLLIGLVWRTIIRHRVAPYCYLTPNNFIR